MFLRENLFYDQALITGSVDTDANLYFSNTCANGTLMDQTIKNIWSLKGPRNENYWTQVYRNAIFFFNKVIQFRNAIVVHSFDILYFKKKTYSQAAIAQSVDNATATVKGPTFGFRTLSPPFCRKVGNNANCESIGKHFSRCVI